MKIWHTLRRKPNKVFLIYFFSFFIVILIPVFFQSISSYRLVVATIQDELSQGSLNALNQTGTSLERALKEVIAHSVQLGLDGRIYASARNPENSYLLNDVKDIMKSLSTQNSYIHSVQIYFRENSQIISSDGANRTYHQEPFDLWIEQMEQDQADYIWLPSRSFVNQDGISFRIVTLARKIPVAFPEKSGYAAIHIYEEHFQELLENMDPERQNHVRIIDPRGEVITAYNQDTFTTNEQSDLYVEDILSINTQGYYVDDRHTPPVLVSYGTPLFNGWKVMSVTSLDYLYDKLTSIRRVIAFTGFILIILGAIVSYYLSRTMFNPIRKLLEKSKRYQQELSLSTLDKEDNTLGYVSDMFEKVMNKHRGMEASFKANYPSMLDRFIYNLLYNKIDNSTDIEEKIKYLQLPLTKDYYVVMVIEIDDYSSFAENYSSEDKNLFRFALTNIAQEIADQTYNALCTEISDTQIAVLINLQSNTEDHRERLGELAKQMILNIKTFLGLSVTVSVGGIQEDILHSYLSFAEASDVIHYKVVLGGNKVIFYDEVNLERSTNYYYPAQLEKTIINNILAGNEVNVKGCLHHLRTEINDKPTLSYDNVFRIYSRLLEATIDLLLESNLSIQEIFGPQYNIHQELAKRETVDAITEWMENLFTTVIAHLKGNSKNNSNVEQAIAYIESGYREDLSVERIADAVQLNTAYLSRIFKQSTGKTILEYLTLRRIEESKQLLMSTKLNIHEIAEKVGYNNTNSFIRFFRKFEGITPGDYRKSKY